VDCSTCSLDAEAISRRSRIVSAVARSRPGENATAAGRSHWSTRPRTRSAKDRWAVHTTRRASPGHGHRKYGHDLAAADPEARLRAGSTRLSFRRSGTSPAEVRLFGPLAAISIPELKTAPAVSGHATLCQKVVHQPKLAISASGIQFPT